MTDPLPSRLLRIYSWNVNGIAPFLQPAITSFVKTGPCNIAKDPDVPSTTSLRDFLRKRSWPQVVNLQEVKIKRTDGAIKAALANAVNLRRTREDDGPRYSVRSCLPRDSFNATGFGGKTYGVATIIRRDVLEEHVINVREVEWDKEGRVLVLETRERLSIWNVYAVNGTATPYRDLNNGKTVGTRHDKKLSFHKAMADECKRLDADD